MVVTYLQSLGLFFFLGKIKLFCTQDGTGLWIKGIRFSQLLSELQLEIATLQSQSSSIVTSNLDETCIVKNFNKVGIQGNEGLQHRGGEMCRQMIVQVGNLFAKSWNQLDIITTYGWNIVNGLSVMNKFGPVALLGGFGKLGAGSILSNTFDIQYPHYKINIFILWAKIDAWGNEATQIIVDGTLVQEKNLLQQFIICLQLYFLEQNWKQIIIQILLKFSILLISTKHLMKNHLELEIFICIIKSVPVFVISALGQTDQIAQFQKKVTKEQELMNLSVKVTEHLTHFECYISCETCLSNYV
ncbi:unnamed protein product (macronuclear) [Paramecium tetraurelia]|uniref:Uncharacterized protein n=1 Tax=Paramecium tetraurelia TaxID=5888 RepID=A0DMN5_PARTE|nr:uncharacterized protein GSPATT00018506001 [Paramecium tetraurelia]CAK84302.1 unnamed protein product [Paramecium tetraurelia]|eukprot:XP_001451699.1 hypothetical protein (macronuclear) [Paramecium tetraurelia strain d4-2]